MNLTNKKVFYTIIKQYLLLFAFILLVFSCKKNGGNDIVIKGNISELESPTILAAYVSGDTLAIDTIKSNRNGKFSYNVRLDTLTVFSLYFNEQKTSVSIFADKGDKIKLNGDANFPDLMKITGNDINNELTSFKETNQDLLLQRAHLINNLEHVNNNVDTVSNGRTLSNTEDVAQINSLNHQLLLKAEDFIKENPKKASSLVLINDFFSNAENPMALERVLGYIEGDVKNSQLALNLKAFSDKINSSAEGAPMPYFNITDKDGKAVTSNDFRGKYLLLSFVSAASKDSRESIQVLKRTYADLPKDSVAFLTVYIDSDIYPISYIESDSVPWTVVPEKKSWASDIVDAYNIQFIPNNILISPQGIITDRNIHPAEAEKKINRSAQNGNSPQQ